ncbi:transglycosylase family protein [Streptomyces sp. CNQ085]|uniref:transglycosylase family protein n=1 Tax=Streptomyces sp. CNQ085 TaxID=2886944 RepID=UPI001F5132EF|nr:transglycosylase family protein [Streptomyces sp. CNQ085]MCI0386605.1 transglycosylase family protein [Streptomyces sp. CNQ085]
MLSGNGRHRRPRRAPAVFVTAGVTGAGFAIPLLGAAGAQAADLDTWDRVAQCESGGLWSADTGNGYYGGLQLTQEIWERYGGTAYAERPDLASRSQQVAVAEKILAGRGPDAWPSCGVNAGLRHDTTGEAPAIDPDNLLPEEDARDGGGGGGVLDGTAPGGDAAGEDSPAEDGGGAESGGGAKDGAQDGSKAPEGGAGDTGTGKTGAGDGTEAGGADDAAEGGSRAGAGEGAGKHRGERDPRELELERGADGAEDREAAGEERSGEAADRSARAERPALAGTVSGLGVRAADEGHLVRPGESLVTIAQEHGVPGGWSGLYENNKDVVGEDPDLILPGQELTLG